MSAREDLAAVLRDHEEDAHTWTFPDGTRGRRCTCRRAKFTADHLASVILADWLPGALADERVVEAARATLCGATSDVETWRDLHSHQREYALATAALTAAVTALTTEREGGA